MGRWCPTTIQFVFLLQMIANQFLEIFSNNSTGHSLFTDSREDSQTQLLRTGRRSWRPNSGWCCSVLCSVLEAGEGTP